jgi:hypothetical protein
MDYGNKISTRIPAADLKEILEAIRFIEGKLSELVSLSNEEMSALPKMKSNALHFIEECLIYADQYPDTIPGSINVVEIKKDYELIRSITAILDPLMRLKKRLEDSAQLAGSEAYLPCIAIHNAVKNAQSFRTGTKKDLQVSRS